MNWIKRFFGASESPEISSALPELPTEVTTPAALRARYGGLYRPAVHLRPCADESFSRLGGLPSMPTDFEWPIWNDRPQSFLAQIDLAEVHRSMPSCLPEAGYLYFFYDQEQGIWGFDPKDLGGWRVLYSPVAQSKLVEHPAPEGLPDECIFKAKPVRPHLIELLPDSQSLPKVDFEWRRDGEVYSQLRLQAFEGTHCHQMLGYPSPVQNDKMEEECQLASNGVYIGNADCGAV